MTATDGPFQDHFRNPRHTGVLADADGKIEVENPVCGDVLVLHWRRGDVPGTIERATFQVYGCPAAIAAGSFMIERLVNDGLPALREWTAERLAEELGGLQGAQLHAATLAIDALDALRKEID